MHMFHPPSTVFPIHPHLPSWLAFFSISGLGSQAANRLPAPANSAGRLLATCACLLACLPGWLGDSFMRPSGCPALLWYVPSCLWCACKSSVSMWRYPRCRRLVRPSSWGILTRLFGCSSDEQLPSRCSRRCAGVRAANIPPLKPRGVPRSLLARAGPYGPVLFQWLRPGGVPPASGSVSCHGCEPGTRHQLQPGKGERPVVPLAVWWVYVVVFPMAYFGNLLVMSSHDMSNTQLIIFYFSVKNLSPLRKKWTGKLSV